MPITHRVSKVIAAIDEYMSKVSPENLRALILSSEQNTTFKNTS